MSSETVPNPDLGPGEAAPVDDALQKEVNDLRDRLLRTTAEFDNYRKRTDRERRELSEFAAADLAKDLLPVIDDLDRALDVSVETTESNAQLTALREGVGLVRRQFLDVLQRRGVEAIETVGHPFDPTWHEALATEAADGRPDGEVTAEIRRGYRIGQRLLRPALVKVAQS